MSEKFASSLNAAEDKTAAQLESDFLKAVRITIKETDWQKLEQDLQYHHQGDEVIDGISWEEYDPRERLKSLFEVALEIHGDYLGTITGGAKFDFIDPNALKWITEYGAQDIKYISDSSKSAIKEILLRGYQDGNTPVEMAREIRAHIGLDEARSKTLQKYSENLFAKGKSDAEVWRLVEARGKQLLNARARTISVNEVSEAGGRATYESTRSAVERGVIDPYLYEGFRIVTADERTCERCAPLSGEARKLPDGTYLSTGSQIPKVHIKCRCVEGLREMKKQSMKKRASGQGRMPVVFDCQALKRKDGVLYVPTVPMIEGVYEQWGFRVLRSYAEFSQYSHWLHGIPIVVNHEEVTPEARRVGQLFDVQNKPDGLKASAISRFYEIDCTQRELEALLSGQPHDGSLRWSCYLVDEPGEWVNPTTGERKQYDVKEVGPYTFVEYSFVKQGVIGTNDGAGFNMQCKDCNHNHQLQEEQSMSDETIEEMKQQITAANEKSAALEQKITELTSRLDGMEQKAEADRTARIFEAFQSKLKPGHQEKAKELFEAYQKDPAGWTLENSDKFIQAGRERQLSGRAITDGGSGGFNLEHERAKLKAEGKVI